MKVAEALAEAFAAEGASSAFGLMGDGNMDFLSAVLDRGKVSVYDARHEAMAVSMADGFARGSGDVGVATVTCGPGVTQLGTSLTVANRKRSPVVVLGGDTHNSQKGMGALQDLNQRAFVEASGALFHQLRGPSTVAADVQYAFWLARTRRQPVFLNCPIDVQEAEAPGELRYVPSRTRIAAAAGLAPDPAAVEKAADMLAATSRPLIVAGAGAVASGARDVIDRIADRVGAAVGTTVQGKGYLDGSWSIGIVGSFSTAKAEPIAAAADLVVLVGASGSANTTMGFPPGARTLYVDSNPLAALAGRPADHFVLGDARLTLEAIEALLVQADFSATGFRDGSRAEVFSMNPLNREIDDVDWDLPPGVVDPRKVIRDLDPILPELADIVIGAGHFWSFPTMYLSSRRTRQFHFTYDFGCIGQAIPTAFGISVARPDRPVIVFEGDASTTMNIQELDTIARYQPRMLVFVMNDGSLGAEFHKLRSKGLDPEYSLVQSPDFAAVARAFGNPSGTICRLEDVGREVDEFKAATGPRIVNVCTSTTVVSRYYRKAFFGADR